jgi:hypothetical protein
VRIAVGKADGPPSTTGEVVHDPPSRKKLMEEFAKKYPEGWSRFAGFRDGSRVATASSFLHPEIAGR